MQKLRKVYPLIFLVIFAIVYIHSFRNLDGDARAKWPLLKQEFFEVSQPSLTAIQNAQKKHSNVNSIAIYQDYQTYLNSTQIKDFYEADLKKHGWTKYSQEVGSRELTSEKVSFCKNGLEAIIEFPQHSPLSYLFIMRWQADRTMRPTC